MLLTVVITLTAAGTGAVALAAQAEGIYVTIIDNTGKMQLTQQYINVPDTDNDGAITVKDALYKAHELYYGGGAAAGFSCSHSLEWGWSLTKLWGQTNLGSFGYYINNAAAYSLVDTLKDGDYLNAFCYTDSKNYTDAYSFFNVCTKNTSQYSTVSLTLFYYTYNYTTWELITVPLAGAELTVDGEKTGIITDENGKAEITFNKAGSFTVSAVSADRLIIAPVCTVNASQAGLLARLLHFFAGIISFLLGIFKK